MCVPFMRIVIYLFWVLSTIAQYWRPCHELLGQFELAFFHIASAFYHYTWPLTFKISISVWYVCVWYAWVCIGKYALSYHLTTISPIEWKVLFFPSHWLFKLMTELNMHGNMHQIIERYFLYHAQHISFLRTMNEEWMNESMNSIRMSTRFGINTH